MKLTGPTDSEVHAIYTHREVKTLAAAIEKTPGLVSHEARERGLHGAFISISEKR